MAFDVSGKRYPELSAALEALEADGLDYVIGVWEPGGVGITETAGATEKGKELVGSILSWFILQIAEDHGEASAREWLNLAYRAAGTFLGPLEKN